jgi:hypothetical protein
LWVRMACGCEWRVGANGVWGVWAWAWLCGCGCTGDCRGQAKLKCVRVRESVRVSHAKLNVFLWVACVAVETCCMRDIGDMLHV